jgi:hypothetical protein
MQLSIHSLPCLLEQLNLNVLFIVREFYVFFYQLGDAWKEFLLNHPFRDTGAPLLSPISRCRYRECMPVLLFSSFKNMDLEDVMSQNLANMSLKRQHISSKIKRACWVVTDQSLVMHPSELLVK